MTSAARTEVAGILDCGASRFPVGWSLQSGRRKLSSNQHDNHRYYCWRRRDKPLPFPLSKFEISISYRRLKRTTTRTQSLYM